MNELNVSSMAFRLENRCIRHMERIMTLNGITCSVESCTTDTSGCFGAVCSDAIAELIFWQQLLQ